jgi:hypothetical protein
LVNDASSLINNGFLFLCVSEKLFFQLVFLFSLLIYSIENSRDEFEVEIHSIAGKYECRMDENSSFFDLLKKVYPDRIKMQLGYFSKTINIDPKF